MQTIAAIAVAVSLTIVMIILLVCLRNARKAKQDKADIAEARRISAGYAELAESGWDVATQPWEQVQHVAPAPARRPAAAANWRNDDGRIRRHRRLDAFR